LSQQHPPPPALKPPPPILEPPIPLPQDPPAPKALPQPQGLRPTALQHCPRKLNRSSRDFRLPVEKEAGGWRLGQSKVSLSSEGCSRGERPNYAPQGAWGRHPVTGAGMANFLVTQPDASSACAPEKGDCCHHNENMPAHRSCFHTPAITLSALTCAGGRRAAFG
jgi:hypothetical protein